MTPNKLGQTPLDLSIQKEQWEIFRLFAFYKEPIYCYINLIAANTTAESNPKAINVIFNWMSHLDLGIDGLLLVNKYLKSKTFRNFKAAAAIIPRIAPQTGFLPHPVFLQVFLISAAIWEHEGGNFLRELQRIGPNWMQNYITHLARNPNIIALAMKHGSIGCLNFYKENFPYETFKGWISLEKKIHAAALKWLYQNDPEKTPGSAFGLRTAEFLMSFASQGNMINCMTLLECDPAGFRSAFDPDRSFLKHMHGTKSYGIYELVRDHAPDIWEKFMSPLLTEPFCTDYELRAEVLNFLGEHQLLDFLTVKMKRFTHPGLMANIQTKAILAKYDLPVEILIQKYPFLKKIEAYLLCCQGREDIVIKKLVGNSLIKEEKIPILHDLIVHLRMTNSLHRLEEIHHSFDDEMIKLAELGLRSYVSPKGFTWDFKLLNNLLILMEKRPETYDLILPTIGRWIAESPTRKALDFAAGLPENAVAAIRKKKENKIFPKLELKEILELNPEQKSKYYNGIMYRQGRVGVNYDHLQRTLEILPPFPQYTPQRNITALLTSFKDFCKKNKQLLLEEAFYGELSQDTVQNCWNGLRHLLGFVNGFNDAKKDLIVFNNKVGGSYLKSILQCCLEKLGDPTIHERKKAQCYLMLATSGYHCGSDIVEAIFFAYDVLASEDDFTPEQRLLRVLEKARIDTIGYITLDCPDHVSRVFTQFNFMIASGYALGIRLGKFLSHRGQFLSGLQLDPLQGVDLFNKSYDLDAILNEVQNNKIKAGVKDYFLQTQPPKRLSERVHARGDIISNPNTAYCLEMENSCREIQCGYICEMLENLNVINVDGT